VKFVVLASWEDPDGLRCVDILSHKDGSFGFVICRRDPKDGHGWRHIGAASGERFSERVAAEAAAKGAAPWCVS